MKPCVLKFGGAAVASPDLIKKIASLIADRRGKNPRVVVVVSAMGKTTDELLFLARQVSENPPGREQDMLISVGERVSMSLLAMALAELGVEAVSFTGSQSGIITTSQHASADIIAVRPHRLLEALDRGAIAIVAGFQGVSQSGEITTLGRGGSDTSAVALAVALGASEVEFFKDVLGICTADPKVDRSASVLRSLSHREAIEMAKKGSEVLNQRALSLAEKNGLVLKVIPFYSPEEEGTLVTSQKPSSSVAEYEEKVPSFKWERLEKTFIMTLVSKHHLHVTRFFYDMISRWLLPGHPVNITNFSSTQFLKITLQELRLECHTDREAEVIERNMTFLRKEILLGVTSIYHATKILEMKGLSLDEKTALVQEKIARAVQRFPAHFDYDIFAEMQHFFAVSKESFKSVRETSHISTLIYTLYLFRKKLELLLARAPCKRHLLIKLKKNILQTPFGIKEVLSVYLGLNFLKEHEIFEQRHLLAALSYFIPDMRSISDSFYLHDVKEENLGVFYLEIEKKDGAEFSREEIEQLTQKLPGEICSRIEQLVPPIFMPRNEEEVMRGILTLSKQINSSRDIPQMIISFDRQTDTHLSFTVILVRLRRVETLPLKTLFQTSSLFKNLSFEQIRPVGKLRNNIPKEAAVIRAKLPTQTFYRDDYSVDLSEARAFLSKAISHALGQVRDFNGGMIAKQNENFISLKQLLGDETHKHPLILQNFFHAISPGQLSATLDPQLLKTLFIMLLEALESSDKMLITSKKERDHLFVMLKFEDFGWKQKIFQQIEKLNFSSELVSMHLQIFDAFYLGFLYLSKEKEHKFLEAISEVFACHTPF